VPVAFKDYFLNPVTDGVVLPTLQLNGDKIATPTVLRCTEDDPEIRNWKWDNSK